MKLSRRAFTSGFAGSAFLAPWLLRAQAHFFNADQMETVAVIADLIIPRTDTPGARDALVHQHLDRILAASGPQDQSAFLEGLNWFEQYSTRTYSKPFLQLDSKTQLALLRELSESPPPDLARGKAFVEDAKRWTARIYYSTAIGYQELNKGGRVPSTYSSPACA